MGKCYCDATRLSYTPPAPGQKDPGYQFSFEHGVNGLGSQKIEFVVVNGNETRSQVSTMEVRNNPIVNDSAFIVSVYQGIYGRTPVGFEQAYWSQ